MEEINTRKNELKRESFDSITAQKDILDEEDEELDFYHFIEVVSEKIDDITAESISLNQEKENNLNTFVCVLVEKRREDSGQRRRRTVAEREEQRRIVKSRLQQLICVWSENFKRPNFIRTRDKISFSIGVANACFSPLIGLQI